MSGEVGIEDLLLAHHGLGDIIRSFYPDEVEGDAGEAIDVISTATQDNLSTFNSSQAVNSFLEDVSALAKARQKLTTIVEKINIATMNENSSSLTHPEVLVVILNPAVTCPSSSTKQFFMYVFTYPTMSEEKPIMATLDLITLVGELVDILSNVDSHIRLVEDHAQNSVLKRSDSCISSLTHTVTDLRNTLGDISALQSLITGMLNVQE
ncbi:hypothetical protein Hamer_G002257 [Homarus americanus]|uniref:Uncharacterized protein n=1 Tax=Homarus americanus TaxID=6706 RepID=A0A8J5K189_HOMAM|nr:hypothetical protein Hamer_G002257 [Homarus americanus]